MALRSDLAQEFFDEFGRENFPGTIGFRVTRLAEGILEAELEIHKGLLAPNGFLHAATVVGLADTAAGYACIAHLPPGATSFTTIELKCNFIGTATGGTLRCEASAVHMGRSSQVWDANVIGAGRRIALFRCTQLILWPRAADAAAS